MSERQKRSRKEKRRLQEFYAERHKRIKDERKLFLNTLIGLSGGAIVLSITFLEKIAPGKHHLGLVIVAWCLLGVAILVSVFGLISMIWLSQRFQRELEEIIQRGDDESFLVSLLASPHRLKYRTLRTRSWLTLPEYWAGCLFVLGILALAGFAIINLVSR